jgi:raffinose/stachyose/melibiose transport system substrate-binding protein
MRSSAACIALAVCLALLAPAAFAGGSSEAAATQTVTLRMGSWRADDVAQMTAFLARFSEKHPGIRIDFQPTNPPDYNATLRLQLESGTGPDLMYARSYATGEQLLKDGYFADLSGLPGLATAYDEGTRSPWLSSDGRQFAVPLAAVSHGIYYNKDIFARLGLTIPTTWEAFLETCRTIKAAGIIPVANSLGDEWDINEVVFMSLAPNFIGGREGRLAYENGTRQFNDASVVAAFQAVKDLAPFLPQGFEALTYNDSNALFATGQAAMYFDGSWTIGTFNDVSFEWSVFAVPPPAGKPGYVCFHADAGMAMNAATKHRAEAETFLTWLMTKEGTETLANNMPTGFFPMANHSVTISDRHANAFLKLNEGRGTDVRWAWPKLMAGEPSGYKLMNDGVIDVIKGVITPKQAADRLRDGLAQWYRPGM